MVKLIMFSFKHVKYYHHLADDVHERNVCTYVHKMCVLLGWGFDY